MALALAPLSMQNPYLFHEQSQALAAYLRDRREVILNTWREDTDADPTLTSGRALTRTQFNDHIPNILEAFEHRLEAPEHGASTEARRVAEDLGAHGLHRWQQGFQLREVTREWGHLQLCIMCEIELYAREHEELSAHVIAAAHRILAELCLSGISDSVEEYWTLQQREAASHIRDLEQAMTSLEALENIRATTWRQAAHDLRGSLTVVRAASDMLHDVETPHAMKVQTSAILNRSVGSLHEMLTDLIDLARLEAGQEQCTVAPFDAGETIRDYCATLQPLAAKAGLYLHTEGPDTLPVEGDRSKIQRILQNLVLNGLKYTKKGGLTVSWHSCNDERWSFSVRDTGPGLQTGTHSPLAEKLQQATQKAKEVSGENPSKSSKSPTPPSSAPTSPSNQLPGEGIGLSIVKGLCNMLNATLELDSTPGQGTTFRVGLPKQYPGGCGSN